MFDNQYELHSFQSQVRRGDARHLSPHGSNIEKAFKINRKLNIYKWIRVTRNQKNRPTFPQGGAERSTSGVWNDKPQICWKCKYFVGFTCISAHCYLSNMRNACKTNEILTFPWFVHRICFQLDRTLPIGGREGLRTCYHIYIYIYRERDMGTILLESRIAVMTACTA